MCINNKKRSIVFLWVWCLRFKPSSTKLVHLFLLKHQFNCLVYILSHIFWLSQVRVKYEIPVVVTGGLGTPVCHIISGRAIHTSTYKNRLTWLSIHLVNAFYSGCLHRRIIIKVRVRIFHIHRLCTYRLLFGLFVVCITMDHTLFEVFVVKIGTIDIRLWIVSEKVDSKYSSQFGNRVSYNSAKLQYMVDQIL